ncbi:zinc-binding domain-containing protein [Annulohypoxylon moriforme]|nr:zinc-binding domain-containing protein [Annulohypoxylon moriforme]
MPNKRTKSDGAKAGGKTSYVYPQLHSDISKAVLPDIKNVWYNKKGSKNYNNEYSTHVRGSFRCDNENCSKRGWSSGKVAIQIRGYPTNGYKAVVFNQRCRSCDTLGALTLDEKSYVDRVAYRLKKWAGIELEEPPHGHGGSPPHRRDLCEGCRLGVCTA